MGSCPPSSLRCQSRRTLASSGNACHLEFDADLCAVRAACCVLRVRPRRACWVHPVSIGGDAGWICTGSLNRGAKPRCRPCSGPSPVAEVSRRQAQDASAGAWPPSLASRLGPAELGRRFKQSGRACIGTTPGTSHGAGQQRQFLEVISSRGGLRLPTVSTERLRPVQRQAPQRSWRR
jgi:hypothetical protein